MSTIIYTPSEDFIKEHAWHGCDWNIVEGKDYIQDGPNFNAGSCWEGQKHLKESKQAISKSNKEFYKSKAGIERRQKISDMNKETKSDLMKEKWKDPDFIEKMRQRTGEKPSNFSDKKRKEMKEYWSENKSKRVRKLLIEGKIYNSAHEAAKVYNIDPVNIRRRCRLNKYTDWSYL